MVSQPGGQSSTLRLSMPYVVVCDPNHVIERAHVCMVKGLDQGPPANIHANVSLAIRLIQVVSIPSEVPVLLGYVLLLKIHPRKENRHRTGPCKLSAHCLTGGQIASVKVVVVVVFLSLNLM